MKNLSIVVCLLIGMAMTPVRAVTYTSAPYSRSEVGYSAPATDFRSTSAYASSRQTAGSISAISASNFETLNGEGGACNYTPYGPNRVARPTGSGAMGVVDTHSPVGDIPLPLFLLLAGLYLLLRRKAPKAPSASLT